jgi:DNA-nicking Smr family endonuclease
MKKKKNTEQKKKDFIHSPFQALKGFTTERTETDVKQKEAPKPALAKAEEDDRGLFLRSVADVKRINPEAAGEKSKKTAPPVRKKNEDEERRLFLESLKKMDVTFVDEIPDVRPIRPMAVSRMRQLKTGAVRIDLQLDLHGMTRDQALESIRHFITGAYNRGQRAVLVITGRGNNSPGEPVLQGAVMSWLRETGKGMVAEFSPAPHQMGGAGALVVFLKDKDKERSVPRK